MTKTHQQSSLKVEAEESVELVIPQPEEDPNTNNIRLYPHQNLLLTIKKRHIVMLAGVGTGKSYTGMLRIYNHCAEWAGTQVLIGRYRKNDLERTVWREFNKNFAPYIRDKNEQKLRITMWNGSQIHFVNLWDPQHGVEHLDGYNISAFMISQAEQVPEICYLKLLERSRNMEGIAQDGRKITKMDHLRILEGNPHGKDWIYNRFYKPKISDPIIRTEWVNKTKKEYKIYSTRDSVAVAMGSDNFRFVPDDYLETISQGSERHIKRYINGEFEGFTGAVYDCYSEEVHLCDPFPIKEDLTGTHYKRYLGFDWGLRNPCAVLWMIHNEKENIYYCYRELYVTNMVAGDVARKVLQMSGSEIIHGCFVDPAIKQRSPETGKALLDTINEVWNPEGLIRIPIILGNNDLEYGIQQVYTQFMVKNGHPGLYVMRDRCPNLEFELKNYKYPEDDDVNTVAAKNLKELPVDKHNHHMSGLRYVICTDKPITELLDPISTVRKELPWK